MEMSAEIVDGKLCHIKLTGRMDVEGIASIDKKFTAAVEDAKLPVIVDMSDVPYMSSIGIRLLLINAKSAGATNKKYFIVGPQDEVENVLKISGIDQLITIYKEMGDAIAHL